MERRLQCLDRVEHYPGSTDKKLRDVGRAQRCKLNARTRNDESGKLRENLRKGRTLLLLMISVARYRRDSGVATTALLYNASDTSTNNDKWEETNIALCIAGTSSSAPRS